MGNDDGNGGNRQAQKNALTVALANFPLEDWLALHGATEEGRHEMMLLCPVCSSEKLSVRMDSGHWRCFHCEQYTTSIFGRRLPVKGAGSVFNLVKWVEGLTTKETVFRILELGDPPIGDASSLPDLTLAGEAGPEDSDRAPAGLPHGAVPLATMVQPPEYVLRRGISREDAASWGLHYVPPGCGRYSHRLVFPVWAPDGRCLYWQARACWDQHEHVMQHAEDKFRKTLNPSQEYCGLHGKFPKGLQRCPACNAPRQFGSSDVLLNIGQACRYPRVGICEGPTSAIRGGPSCVATFGKQLSPQQMTLLVAHGVRAVDFMWDGPSPKEPEGAREAMLFAASQLAAVIDDVRIVFYPSGDPGDYTRPDNDYFRTHAVPYHLTTSML